MALDQPIHRYAWVLDIEAEGETISFGTTDLPEEEAQAALGRFYPKRIKSPDTTIVQSMTDVFYGIQEGARATFNCSNVDRVLDPATDYRGLPALLRHYDRETNDVTTELSGIVLEIQYPGDDAIITIGSHHDGLFDTLLPTQVVDVATLEFATSQDAGIPLPVIFGKNVVIRPTYVADDSVTQSPYGFDYIVGYDADLRVETVFTDVDEDQAGLERLGVYRTAPGTPVYASTSSFTVTGDQAKAYGLVTPGGTVIGGMPLRCHTTASGTATWLYTALAGYSGGTASGTVTVYDPIFDSGLHSVEIGGDFNIIRDGYVNVEINPTEGIQADFTAIRLYFPERGGLIVQVSNPDLTNPAAVIAQIMTNDIWGLSSVTPQGLDGASFIQASIDFTDAGLDEAVAGALGGDRAQRTARDVLNEILMMRGARLTYSATLMQWVLEVDTAPAAATLTFSLGDGLANNIKRINSYGYVPLSQAVRNFVVAFESPGRARAVLSRYVPGTYRQRATVAVSGLGRDRTITSPWIRTQQIASRVAYYMAKKLQAAERPLSITVGQEGRQLQLGDLIHVEITDHGIDADYQVVGIARSLIETTLTLHVSTPEAYTFDADQVVITDAPQESEQRFVPGVGGNEFYNANLSSPPWSPFNWGTTIPTWPHDWSVGAVDGNTALLEYARYNYNAVLRAGTLSGNYVQLKFSALGSGDFNATSVNGLASGGLNLASYLSLKPSTDYIVSIYCSRTEGLEIGILVNKLLVGFEFIEPTVVVDLTDTNNNGWVRHYSRFKTSADAIDHVIVLFHQNTTHEYLLEAPMLERVTSTSKRPSPWRASPKAAVTTLPGDTTGLSGSRTVIHTIPAGSTVMGVTIGVAATISANYDVGTDADPTAWADNCDKKAVGDRTNVEDFQGGNPTHYPTSTQVFIRTAGGGTVTFSAGTVTASIDFLRAAPSTIT